MVHNRTVVDDLKTRGAVFVDELTEVPDDAIVIFSAHGVSKAVQDEAARRQLKVFDATCPLVTKVHMEVIRFAREGRECILIGHAGHPEVEGTMGQFDRSHGGVMVLVEDEDDASRVELRDPATAAFVTQTTLSMDDTARIIDVLKTRFPEIKGPRTDDICYATQNRQDAVKRLAGQSDLVLVVGSPNSSNSNRLRELAERLGAEAHLVDAPEQIQAHWVNGKQAVAVTAGASAPESVVQAVCARLTELGADQVSQEIGVTESVQFSLPKELRLHPIDSD
jgi:(E)-4-hydroxy-3-methyl-but-2-enyl pyrophosphate reductase (IPP and DMAPP forming)